MDRDGLNRQRLEQQSLPGDDQASKSGRTTAKRQRSVFLSYSRTDRHLMRLLARQLEAHGHTVWADESRIDAGDVWAAEIVAAIRQSDALVLLATAASVKSSDVRKEVGLAGKYGIPVVPVMVPPVRIPDEIDYHISNRHQFTVDAENPSLGFAAVARDIEGLPRPKRPLGCGVLAMIVASVLAVIGLMVWTLVAGSIPPWSGHPTCESVTAEVVATRPATFGPFDQGVELDIVVRNNSTRTVRLPSQRDVLIRGASGDQYSPSSGLADGSWFLPVELQGASNARLQLGIESAESGSDEVAVVIPDVKESALPFLKCTVPLTPVRVTFPGG